MSNENLEIKIAKTQKEKDMAYQVRYEVFVEERGNLAASKFSNRMEIDSFDDLETTVNFLALVNENAIGTVRLIEDSEKGLPIEDYVDLSGLRAAKRKLSEGGRLAVLKDYRGKEGICIGLFKIGMNYARMKDITDMCIISSALIKKIYEAIGWYPIGDQRYSSEFSDNILPMRLELDKIREPFRSMFAEPWAEIEKPYHKYKK